MGPLNTDRGPVVMVAATVWWPLSARLAIALARAGCSVKAICPPGHPLRCVSGIEKIYNYRGIHSIAALERALRDAQPDIVVPCDDGVVWQLHALQALHPDLRPLIERSLGPARMYTTIRSRGDLLAAAAELGIRIPETQTIHTEQELAAWTARSPSSVLKLDGTWGGTGVEVIHSEPEARAVFHRMSRPTSLGVTYWKRFLINRDPLALWNWRQKQAPVVTAQRFISGRPANTMFLAWRGELISSVTVEVLCAQGATGAATVVRLIDNHEMTLAAKLLARRLELSGFYGLDFIVEQATGASYLIELNPRCTQLGHLPLPGRGDLAGALYEQLSGSPPAAQLPPIPGDTIAFFPQTAAWSPNSPYLRTAYQDIPREEPGLMRELQKESWPERQWPARIYHYFRNPHREQAVEFEAPLAVGSRTEAV